MPVIKVTDLAYVRVRLPDLDRAEQFFNDFGLVRADRTANALYMRGTGTAHHVHVAELGEAKFLSLAFLVDREADLHALRQVAGASEIEPIDEPGGGQRVGGAAGDPCADLRAAWPHPGYRQGAYSVVAESG